MKGIGLSTKIAVKGLLGLTNAAIRNDSLRRFVLKNMEKKIYDDLIIGNPDNRPVRVQEDKYYMGRALIRSIDRAISKGHISKEASRGLLDVFLGNVFFGGFYKRMEYMKKYGYRPPVFMTISPGKACNLRCIGCYAASGGENKEKLPWSVTDEIIMQAKELWGMNFFVISGGEPLLYKDNGKGILDLFEKHSDSYFLMYTNGTLINKDVAQRMAKLGNVTPSISVEGLREETDYRRGKGVFDKILKAYANLREAGVPFGMSITATRLNINTIMSEE
ncbi:radical SAM protein, partial [candidate division WOR-3 bacterium]|nr:radical SAM protein [candidate division WOR-3 bacterium]